MRERLSAFSTLQCTVIGSFSKTEYFEPFYGCSLLRFLEKLSPLISLIMQGSRRFFEL